MHDKALIKISGEWVLLEKLGPGVVQYSCKTIIQPPFQVSFILSPLSGPRIRRVGGRGAVPSVFNLKYGRFTF